MVGIVTETLVLVVTFLAGAAGVVLFAGARRAKSSAPSRDRKSDKPGSPS